MSDFYSAISEGRLSQALAFWTQNMQNSCDPSSCIFDRFGHTQSIRIQSRQVLYQSDNEAAVRVTVYDQEGEGSSRASGPITLTWYLVNDGSGWRLNNVGA